MTGLVVSPSAVTFAQAPAPEPAQPGLGIRLLEAPEALRDDPRAHHYIIDHVEPGTTINRRVEVSNRTGAPQQVEVYPGPAEVVEDGGFTFAEKGQVNELSTWISVDDSNFDLPDGALAEPTVTIDVPDDAPEGEQYAVIWAEIASPVPEGTGAQLASRVGVRVYLSVGPGNPPAADFEITALTPQRNADGVAEVLADVTNTGGRAVDITGEIEVSEGPAGLRAGPFAMSTLTLAPGDSGQAVFSLSADLPNGPWRADVQMTSGLITRELSADITFPDTGVGETTAVDGRSWTPWIWGSVIVLLGIALVFSVLAARRKRTVGAP